MNLINIVPAIKKSSVAKNIDNKARDIVEKAQCALDKEKSLLQVSLQNYGTLKINVFQGPIYDFVELFSRLKEVELSEEIDHDELSKTNLDQAELARLREASMTMKELTTGGIASLTTGALTGAAVYGTVNMLATASTGTAISTLSGAAATNATLAWLGGGTIAAGGGGMAAGMIVLGGLVTAPVLLVGYAVLNAKANDSLAKAKQNLLEAKRFRQETRSKVSMMEAIQKRISQMRDVLLKLSENLENANKTLQCIVNSYGFYFPDYPEKGKRHVYRALLYAQATKSVLDIQLLDKEGRLTKSSQEIVKRSIEFLKENDNAR